MTPKATKHDLTALAQRAVVYYCF